MPFVDGIRAVGGTCTSLDQSKNRHTAGETPWICQQVQSIATLE
jgi:hypothetical protein